jgi:hypothetical protein
MKSIFADAGVPFEQPLVIENNAGHQDVIVGETRELALNKIEEFFEKPAAQLPQPPPPSPDFIAYAPWMGPVITIEPRPTISPTKEGLLVRVGSSPMHREAAGIALLRVALDGDHIVRPDDPSLPWDDAYVQAHMGFLYSSELAENRWDAFDAPEPHQMPGHAVGQTPIGDALLVLILYADSQGLGPPPAEFPMQILLMDIGSNQLGEFFAYPEQNPSHPPGAPVLQPVGVNPVTGPVLHPVRYSHFEQGVKAVARVLRAQPGVRLRDAARLRLDARVAQITLADDGELMLPIGNMTTMSATTTVAPATPGQAAAITGALTDQDSDVLDGVIPWDMPQNPVVAPQDAGTRFALLSCQYPAGFLDAPPAYASYRRLLARLGSATAAPPRFIVMTGDQVYVDPTAGLYDPEAQDDRYHRPYEVWLRRREVRGALRRVPSFMLLDDHEIDDNWGPLPSAAPDSGGNLGMQQQGLKSYRKYERGRHEMPPELASFGFKFDGFPFFMLDTRSERTLRQTGNLATAKLFAHGVGSTLEKLEQWLTNVPQSGPKFIVTPSMFLPRHRRTVRLTTAGNVLDSANLNAFHSDGWDGYPETLRAVLGVLAATPVHHVVFLSGDEHRSCIAQIDLRLKGGSLITRVHSIHTSAAYAPFPFANSLAEEFATSETFEFKRDNSNTIYECVVQADALPARDGATMLRPWKEAGAWRLACESSDGSVRTLLL